MEARPDVVAGGREGVLGLGDVEEEVVVVEVCSRRLACVLRVFLKGDG